MIIDFKPISLDNAELIFGWRNDPFIVALGSLNKTVGWDEHLTWIKDTIQNNNRKAFIIFSDNTPAGQVRFDRAREDDDSCTISIYLIKDFAGKGLGTESIETACELMASIWNECKYVTALVLKDNIIGQKAFMRAGFRYSFLLSDTKHFAYVYEFLLPIPHNKLTFDHSEAENVFEVINTGIWAGSKKVLELEILLKKITGKKHAFAVSSGLSAIRIALLALNIAKGDEVIIPAYSCVAIANAVLSVGAVPVPADVENRSFNIDIDEIPAKINVRTKAIIAVHTFGSAVDICALKKFGIPVIEDCAHALGKTTSNITFGKDGDIVVCSFYATKLVGGGEGGAVLMDDETKAALAVEFRDYTDKEASGLRLNEKMSDIHAALTISQLHKIDEIVRRRKRIALRYDKLLAPFIKKYPGCILPEIQKDRIWYRYVLNFKNIEADHIISECKSEGINAERPVEYWIRKENGNFNNTLCAYNHLVSLPMYPGLSSVQQKIVCDRIEQILKNCE